MAEAPSTLMLMVRLGVSLGLVLALVGAVTWVLRRRGLLRPANRGTDGRLEILDRKALGKRASLVVARVGGTAVLVGVTDTHISVLSEAPGIDAAWRDEPVDAAGEQPADELDPSAETTTESGESTVLETVQLQPLDADVVGIDLASLEATLAATARPTTGARRTGLRGDSSPESTTTTRMSLVETLRELTVRRS